MVQVTYGGVGSIPSLEFLHTLGAVKTKKKKERKKPKPKSGRKIAARNMGRNLSRNQMMKGLVLYVVPRVQIVAQGQSGLIQKGLSCNVCACVCGKICSLGKSLWLPWEQWMMG